MSTFELLVSDEELLASSWSLSTSTGSVVVPEAKGGMIEVWGGGGAGGSCAALSEGGSIVAVFGEGRWGGVFVLLGGVLDPGGDWGGCSVKGLGLMIRRRAMSLWYGWAE